MKTKDILTYSIKNNVYEYEVYKGLNARIEVKNNPYNIPLNKLISMAKRCNPKRSFLFVSKVLGKHIPIMPHIGLITAGILAGRYMEFTYGINKDSISKLIKALIEEKEVETAYYQLLNEPFQLPQPVIFIGFAETATALGHGVFNCFDHNGVYLHTTRELIKDVKPIIEFEEEHSHATSHRCYGLDGNILKRNDPIVLIDDELTTGKTMVNIIEAIQQKYPRTKYTILSILDWRSKEDRDRFKEAEKRLDISIDVISLVSGSIKVKEEKVQEERMLEDGEYVKEAVQTYVDYLYLEDHFPDSLNLISLNSLEEENRTPYIEETGRFGISTEQRTKIYDTCKSVGQLLQDKRRGEKTLCLGTGEFIYLPMLIAAYMGEGVKYHSTTRSPIHPYDGEGYGIKNKLQFDSPDDPSITQYLYNIPYGYYDDLYLFIEREVSDKKLYPLIHQLKTRGIRHITVVFFKESDDKIPSIGSYSKDDVIFLLKDISHLIKEKGTEDREEAIQSGVHYSEMLPIEYEPSQEYMELFHQSLEESYHRLAIDVGIVSEKIVENKGTDIVLVSLARAGTPIGVLIKRYLNYKYGFNLPHYSISIIRGKGIDMNAIRYILHHHPKRRFQFIDGWTGKGVINKVLIDACKQLERENNIFIDGDLAVLADPAHCVTTFGTREDFLIPSACLNATVSGLVSRTVHRRDLVADHDFHGAKYYKHLQDKDVSNLFVDRISEAFPTIIQEVEKRLTTSNHEIATVTWKGLKDIKSIQKDFGIEDVNLIKPGIGETTRVLLRRVPWKILIRNEESNNLKHILLLAKDRGVPVEPYPYMTYECCGLIKPLNRED